MKRVETQDAPQAVGPYSQAIIAPAGEWVFCSGQIALKPGTGPGEMPRDVAAQTRQVLDNLIAVLSAADCGLSDVAKTTIYVTDMAHFGTVNDVYGQYFSDHQPARATVEVSALPLGAWVEIDAIALRRGGA
jgi:2-iminobutanoate/2-iminopropanoate deaminase